MRVEVTLKHGGKDSPDIKEIIVINPGGDFITEIGVDTIWHGDTIVRQYTWRAGYSVVYEYFYQ